MNTSWRFVSSPLATLLVAAAPAQQSLGDLPPDLDRSLREAVVEATYGVTEGEDTCLHAANPAQDMHSAFTAVGIQLSGRDEDWTMPLTLAAWGREGSLHPCEPAEPVARGRRVEYRRGALTEWYVNDPRGLEQGFTLESRPDGEGSLRFALEIGPGWTARVQPGARDALFRGAESGVVVQYTGLRAWDAAERELEAALELDGDRVVLQVDDVGACYPLHVDPWIGTEEAKLTASDGEGSDSFGSEVAISGDTAVIGVYEDDAYAGSAYVFVRSGTTWTEQQKLIASDAMTEDFFGSAVAVSGDTVMVGAPGDDHPGGTDAGSVYVFVRNGTTWSEQQRLVASDAEPTDNFGVSVAFAGDTAVVGANQSDSQAGSAYVFVRSGAAWTEEQKLVASDPGSLEWFGFSVDLFGETILVGAVFDDHPGAMSAGSAYVFVRLGATWTQQQKLVAGDPQASDHFGGSVALWEDTAVIGASGDDNSGGSNAGSAYVFVRSGTTWTEQQKLLASDATTLNQLGTDVCVAGDLAVVGASSGLATEAGSAYLFVRSGTTWQEMAKLTASDGEGGDLLGYAVALSGDTTVVGAPSDDNAGGAAAGSAYVFRLSPASVTYCTAGTSASGCQALLSSAGVASASASSGFDLLAAGVEGARDGLYFFGTNGQQANLWGNGTSYQCVAPPVKRAGSLPGIGTVGQCDGSFSQDLNALWCPTCPKPHKNPGAGAVVQAQLWYRDPLNTSNQDTSLADALEFCLVP